MFKKTSRLALFGSATAYELGGFGVNSGYASLDFLTAQNCFLIQMANSKGSFLENQSSLAYFSKLASTKYDKDNVYGPCINYILKVKQAFSNGPSEKECYVLDKTASFSKLLDLSPADKLNVTPLELAEIVLQLTA